MKSIMSITSIALLVAVSAVAQNPSVTYDKNTGIIIQPKNVTLGFTQNIAGTPAAEMATDTEAAAFADSARDEAVTLSNAYTDTQLLDYYTSVEVDSLLAAFSAADSTSWDGSNWTSDTVPPSQSAVQTALLTRAEILDTDTTVYLGVDGPASVHLSAAAASDEGGGFVGFPAPGHEFTVGDTIRFDGATNYGGTDYLVDTATTADTIVCAATYVAETFSGDEFVLYKQPVTAAELQTIVDSEPKVLDGGILTFIFYDGYYDFESTLTIDGFMGGDLHIYGNAADNTAEANKRIVLSCPSTALYVTRNTSYTLIYYLKVVCSGAGVNGALRGIYNAASTTVRYCSVQCALATSNGITLGYQGSSQCLDTYFNGGLYGLRCGVGIVYTNNNYNSTVLPQYGMSANAATVCVASSSSIPSGSVSDTQVENGGVFVTEPYIVPMSTSLNIDSMTADTPIAGDKLVFDRGGQNYSFLWDYVPMLLDNKLDTDSPAADLDIAGLPSSISPGSGDSLVVEHAGTRYQIGWDNLPGAAGGEANTISSVGGGTSIVKGKTGVDLQNKSIEDSATITWDSAEDTLRASVTAVPAALVSSGTLDSERLPDSGATPGAYGSATKSAVVTVDSKGRVTSVSEADITGGGSSGTWTLVSSFSTSVDVDSVVFAGLDGDTDLAYRITGMFVSDTTAAERALGVRFNGDSSTNYGFQVIYNNSSTGVATYNTTSRTYACIALVNTDVANVYSTIDATVWTYPAKIITANIFSLNSTGNPTYNQYAASSWRSAANVTSITVQPLNNSTGAALTGGIHAGTWFKFYKLTP